MNRDTTAKKIIFFLLDMLLIMGAMVGIMTIDGGRWLISNPAFYQAPEEAVQANAGVPAGVPAVIPVTGANAGQEPLEAVIPQTGDGCQAGSHGAGPEY